MFYFWCCVCLVLKLSTASTLPKKDNVSSNAILVEISSGTLRGISQETWTKNKYLAFKGIPYAEPPVGRLRFKAPVTVKPWKDIKNATEDGNVCPQRDPVFVGGQMDEDCLYLNVYTKKLQGSQPVIVWVHPGAFNFMTGASYWYGPDYLLDQDIVLVSFNYRLDALGFLSTGDKSAVGNYGMKDQVEVLKWIQKNIKYFGGNPQKVTLAGDSAGSAAVFLHMLSPMSQGLFHNAIAMSGGITRNSKWQNSKEQKKGAEKLSHLFNCPTKPVSNMIECLRNIPASDMYTKHEEFKEFSGPSILKFSPVIEPDLGDSEERFLTEHPVTLLKKKSFARVPVITGFTAKEFVGRGVAIAKNTSLVKKLNDEFDKVIPVMFEYDDKCHNDILNITNSIRKFYFGNNSINSHSANAIGEMFSDFIINYGEYSTAKLLSQMSDKPVYFYKFSYIGQYGQEYDPITNKTLGPGHTNDISYLLYPSKIFPKFKETDPEAFMVKRMTSIWYNFASTGIPTLKESAIQWSPVTRGKYLNIDKLFSLEEGWPFVDRMEFWERLLPL